MFDEHLNDLSENVPDTKIDHLSGDINENNIPAGVSIENASYIEKNNPIENESISISSEINSEETPPKLFSEEQSYQSDETLDENSLEDSNTKQLFDQDINEEEDFEIPAVLRKQKF